MLPLHGSASIELIQLHQKPDFLTDYEFDVLRLTNEGMSPQKIANQLNSDRKYMNQKKQKTPESVRKTRVVVRKKIERELRKIANTLRLDTNLRNIPRGTGLLIGYDWVHDTYVYLILTGEKGILAWYEHECSDKCRTECHATLDLIRQERKINLTPEQEKESLLEQFRLIISWIIGEGS